jgi:Fungal Zn(2)-Cys(6) binuclear cluster domain
MSAPTPEKLFTQHDEAAPSLPVPKQQPHKRNRTQLSCTNCRQAKLKCDRQKPNCSQCVKRGRAVLCIFPSPAARRKPTVSMQNRLKHLENLVKDVMTGQSPSAPPIDYNTHSINGKSSSDSSSVAGADFVHNSQPDAASTIAAASSDQVLLGSNESTYVGATHWAAILEDVSCLQHVMSNI